MSSIYWSASNYPNYLGGIKSSPKIANDIANKAPFIIHVMRLIKERMIIKIDAKFKNFFFDLKQRNF